MNIASSIFILRSQIDEALAVAPTQGKKELEPFKSLMKAQGVPVIILEDHAVSDNKVEVHLHQADFWICLEGEATFLVDGEMVEPWQRIRSDGSIDPNEVRAKNMKNAREIVLRPGDCLWIPAGQPHQHLATKTARLLILKLPDANRA